MKTCLLHCPDIYYFFPYLSLSLLQVAFHSHFYSIWRTPFSISLRAFLLATNSLVFLHLRISLFCLKDNLMEYRLLGWHFFYLSILKMSHCLQLTASLILIRNLPSFNVISLYAWMFPFSLVAFKFICLVLVFRSLIMSLGKDFFTFILFRVHWVSCISKFISLVKFVKYSL